MEVIKGKVDAVAREPKNGYRGVKIGEHWYSVPEAQMKSVEKGGIYEFAFEINGNFKNVKAVKSIAAPAANRTGLSGGPTWKDKEIFTQALLKSFIEAGKIEPSKKALVLAGQVILSAYDDIFSPPVAKVVAEAAPAPMPEAEFADEIPF